MNKKRIALASISSLLLSLSMGTQVVRSQANVDSVLPDGNQASSDSIGLTFSNTRGNTTQTATVNVTGATQAEINTAAAAINTSIGNGAISTSTALATLIASVAGSGFTSINQQLPPGSILRVTRPDGSIEDYSPETPRALISDVASTYVAGGTSSYTFTSDTRSITVSITSVPQSSNSSTFIPNLALDPRATGNLIAANLIAQSGETAQGVMETTNLMTQETSKLIVSGNERQMQGGLAAGITAGAAEIDPSGQQISAELGLIAPSVDPILMVELTGNLQGLLSSVNASVPSNILVASADLSSGIKDINQNLMAQAESGGGVDVQKLSDTINIYNKIVETASDEDVEVLAANGSLWFRWYLKTT